MHKKNISNLLILIAVFFSAVLIFGLSQKVLAAPIRTYGAIYIHTSHRSGNRWHDEGDVPVAVNARAGGSFSGACNTGGTPSGRDCGSQGVVVSRSCTSSTGWAHTGGDGMAYFQAPTYGFAACHCSFDIILASLGSKNGNWSRWNGSGLDLTEWHDWYWSYNTGAFGNDNTVQHNFDWCYNECNPGQKRWVCDGNVRRLQTCGDARDGDTCYDWVATGTHTDCGDDYYSYSSNYCSNNDVYRNRTFHDRGCSGGNCFNNTGSSVPIFVQDCSVSGWLNQYRCVSNNTVMQRMWCDKGCRGVSCYNNCNWKECKKYSSMSLCDCRNISYVGGIKASHITQIREDINKNEVIIGKTKTKWTNDPLKAGTAIRYIHTKEMCTAIENIKSFLGLSTKLTCSKDNVTPGAIISGSYLEHVCNDLNNLVKEYNSVLCTNDLGKKINCK